MTEAELLAVRGRFLARLTDAWPERSISMESIDEALTITAEIEEDGPVLIIDLLGTKSWLGFDGSVEQALAVIDSEADSRAYNLEGDRWIGGEGWREYRS